MKKENIFREKLYPHTLPVREGLWEAIEAKLPPVRDQQRFPIFWFFLFASALMGGALMFGLIDQKQQAQPLPADQFLPMTTVINEVETSSISVNLQNRISHGSKISKNPLSNTPPTSSQVTHSKATKSVLSESQLQTRQSQPAEVTEVENIVEANPSAFRTSSNTSSLLTYLPLCETNIQNNISESGGILLLTPDPNCYKFSAGGPNFKLSADFYAGPGFSPRSFESNGDGTSLYSDARNATESRQYAWGAGARINLHLKNGFAARLGLQYEQTGDIFDYTDTLATQSSTRIDSFFASDGSFLYADTSRILVFGTLIKKIHNTYKHLDIPLLIGYELPMGRSLLMVNAGPVFNLTSSHSGQILDPMLHPRTFTSGQPGALPAYKTSLGISLYLSAGALFPLTDHLSALIEPRLLYRIKPVTLDGYPLNEYRHFAGLNLGIRYHFN